MMEEKRTIHGSLIDEIEKSIYKVFPKPKLQVYKTNQPKGFTRPSVLLRLNKFNRDRTTDSISEISATVLCNVFPRVDDFGIAIDDDELFNIKEKIGSELTFKGIEIGDCFFETNIKDAGNSDGEGVMEIDLRAVFVAKRPSLAPAMGKMHLNIEGER